MSQSPSSSGPLTPDSDYFRNWDALGLMIARGNSFSGRERNCAFLNTGTRRFADVSAAAGLDLIDDGRAVAMTDWDHDGDLDLWFANRTAPRLRFVRNDLPSRGRGLAVRLEGRKCNRDAIGARVEVHLESDPPRRLIETLRAGDGFLTQSTKWLSFGLGAYEGPVRLRIRWPGESEWEEFGNLEGGQRYKIVQGSQAVGLVRANDQNALSPSSPKLAEVSDQARVVLTRPVRLPRLEYVDFDQNPRSLPTDHAGPILVNLWASWCTPCLSELREFAEKHHVLDDVGLAIVAVSTDALDREGDPQAAQRFVEAAELPFASGLATTELIRLLSSVHGRVFYKERAFPLPCSFLLDRDGQWAVIYRGGVKAEQLAKDVALLGAEQTVLDTQAFPATGHFVYRGPGINSLAIVEAYREGGYLKDARQELRNLVTRVREKSATPTPSGAAAKSLADVYSKLASIESGLGNPEAAEAAWREAIGLNADSAKLRVGLAIALASQGRSSEAAEHLKSVLRAESSNPETLHLVGKAALQMGNAKQAVESLRKAMSLSPDSVAIQLDLAVALQLAGDVAGAAREYSSLLRREPSTAQAANNLAWLYATDARSENRDGTRAVKLAEHACLLTQNRNPLYLGTLGSAYAEAGRFEEAVDVTQRAVQLAGQVGQDKLVDSLRQRLLLYQKERPFHQSLERAKTANPL